MPFFSCVLDSRRYTAGGRPACWPTRAPPQVWGPQGHLMKRTKAAQFFKKCADDLLLQSPEKPTPPPDNLPAFIHSTAFFLPSPLMLPRFSKTGFWRSAFPGSSSSLERCWEKATCVNGAAARNKSTFGLRKCRHVSFHQKNRIYGMRASGWKPDPSAHGWTSDGPGPKR